MRAVGLALSLIVTSLVISEAVHAQPVTRDEAARPSLDVSGDDPDLTRVVAAELRAAGFAVNEHRAMTVVVLESAPTSVRVRVIRGETRDEILLARPDVEGMSHREAMAIRVAEAVRVMVGAPAADEAEAGDALAPPERPAISEPAAAPAVKATSGRSAGTIGVATPGARDRVGEVARIPPYPIFGLGPVGGVGVVSLRHLGALVPAPVAVAGVRLHGRLAEELSLVGLFAFETGVADATSDASRYDLHGGRAVLLATWEVLGPHHSWTPTLGGGLLGEIRSVRGFAAAHFDSPHGEDPCSEIVADETALCHVDLGLGLTATAGLHFGRPWRFGLEVLMDLRVATIDVERRAEGGALPSALALFFVDYDFVSSDPPRTQTARR